MSQFKFDGSQELTYPDILTNGAVLVAQPGQTYELDSAPDDRWSTPDASQVTTAPSEGQGES